MGKNREEQWKKFFHDCYIEEFRRFFVAVNKKMDDQRTTYQEQFQRMLRDFIDSTNKFDFMIDKEIGSIEISFLRHSVYSDKLQIAYEAYDEKQEMGDCLSGYQLEVDWFQKEWKEHKERLLLAREKEEWIREIHIEDIYVMLHNSIEGLIRGMVRLFKYSLETYPLWEESKALRSSKSFFLVSVGEYRDWQYILYAERGEFDLLTANVSDSCRYGKFENRIYREQPIEKRDVRNSLFDGCTFEKVKFTETRVTDCRFYDCTFYDCDLSGLDFTGAVFINCKFDECNLQSVIWCDPQKTDDVYRPTCVGNTSFTRCGIDASAFENCSVEGLSFHEGERCSP